MHPGSRRLAVALLRADYLRKDAKRRRVGCVGREDTASTAEPTGTSRRSWETGKAGKQAGRVGKCMFAVNLGFTAHFPAASISIE